MSLSRLEAKPQGAVFTGRVEPEGNYTWSKYLLPESGTIIWQCVSGMEQTTWWKEHANITACNG